MTGLQVSVRSGVGARSGVRNKIIDKSNTPSKSGGKGKQPMTPTHNQKKTPKSAAKARSASKAPKTPTPWGRGDSVNGVSMVHTHKNYAPGL